MSRNNSKLGAPSLSGPPNDSDEVVGASQPDLDDSGQADPLSVSNFSFPMTTEVVPLPSHGILYPEGHPLEGVSEIEIKMMTAKEEDILTNTSFIKNGTALDRVLKSIIVDKSLDLNSLMIGDKNALLVASRISAYGSSYDAVVTCPQCMAKNNLRINLQEVLQVEPLDLDELGSAVEITENKTIKITVPRTKFQFELRPRIGEDDKQIEERNKRLRKMKLQANKLPSLTEAFRQVTLSVNGNSDPSVLDKVYENLPAFDFRFLRTTYNDIVPSINMYANLECASCGAEEVISVPMNADFFWPDIKV